MFDHKTCAQMFRHNYRIADLMSHHGWNRIALYGGGGYGQFLFDCLRDTDITVMCVIDRDEHLVFPEPGIQVIKPTEAKAFITANAVDAIVIAVANQNVQKGIEVVLREYGLNLPIVDFDSLFINPYDCQEFKRVEKYVEESGAHLIYFNTRYPTLRCANRTLREKSFVFGFGIFSNPEGNYGMLSDMYADIEHSSLDYIKAVLTPPPIVQIDGIYYNSDVRSQFVNVVNHMRYTTDVPERHDQSIHLFGQCLWFGVGTEDSLTMASHLQRMVNTCSPDGKRYRVLNHSTWGRQIKNNYRRVLSTPFEKGDYCLLYMADYETYWEEMIANKSTVFENITSAYDRPHDQGEIFLDHGHFSHRGHFLTAKKVKERLESSPWWNKELESAPARKQATPLVIKPVNLQTSPGNSGGPPDALEQQLDEYLAFLKKEKVETDGVAGAIVMNCNPFTLGHKHLVERAASIVDYLYVFCVEEDRSEIPFRDRYELLVRGTEEINNVKVLNSGKFILSSITLPEYFYKDGISASAIVNPAVDVEIFARHIAPSLDITIRFAGEEPYCTLTAAYNAAMRDILPKYNILFKVLPRLEHNGTQISASAVRDGVKKGSFGLIRPLVPQTTYDYLLERYGRT